MAFHPKTSLADKLKAAGIVSEKAAEQANEDKTSAAEAEQEQKLSGARATGTIRGITDYYLLGAHPGPTCSDVLTWAARWHDELCAAGHEAALAEAHLTRAEACGAASDAEALAKLERELGTDLPPSLRRFLGEMGGVSWGPYLETLSVGEMPAHVVEVKNLLRSFAQTPPELEGYVDCLELIPLQTVDGNYDFVLRNTRDDEGESMIYFVYHDEGVLYGGSRGMREWLEQKLEGDMDRFADRAGPSV